jgi:hypothetical protein
MQGIRVSKAFGAPSTGRFRVAVGRSDIWTNNPTFGLNALGGAISFQMKDGFTYNGTGSSTPQAAPPRPSAAPCNTACATVNEALSRGGRP